MALVCFPFVVLGMTLGALGMVGRHLTIGTTRVLAGLPVSEVTRASASEKRVALMGDSVAKTICRSCRRTCLARSCSGEVRTATVAAYSLGRQLGSKVSLGYMDGI